PRCIVDGKQYHINDSLKTANVVYKCLGTTIEPLGCYFVNANGQEINVSLGQTLLLDNVQHRCRPGNLNSSSLQTSCVVNGTTHQVGQKWDGGRGFMQECTSDGFIMVSDCIVEPGVNVKIGQTLVHKNYLHSCVRTDSGVRYNADPCGSSGVVCPSGPSNTNQSGQLNPVVNAGHGQCKFEGHILKVGEKYPSPNNGFLYQCSMDGSMVISDCAIVPGLTVETFSMAADSTVCVRDGVGHKSGESWTEKPFELQCQNGVASVKSCIADDNTKISVGTVYRLGKSKLECQKKPDGKVSLISETCHGDGC
uniref:Abnormal cell migration protein 18-like fibronectin type I domain-containing protein n=1 Tax=Romanomermis culicivorax TaxID=13658 RepID=A0A915HKI1_ROMCU